MLSVRQARDQDALILAPRLRMEDIREIRAASGADALEALTDGIRRSTPCFTIIDTKNRPVAVFGVVPDSNARAERVGIVWMLSSAELATHSITFLRHCGEWIDKLQQIYALLWNDVDARNHMSIQWLKWCGFVFIELRESHGFEERAFFRFARYRSFNNPSRSSFLAHAGQTISDRKSVV